MLLFFHEILEIDDIENIPEHVAGWCLCLLSAAKKLQEKLNNPDNMQGTTTDKSLGIFKEFANFAEKLKFNFTG